MGSNGRNIHVRVAGIARPGRAARGALAALVACAALAACGGGGGGGPAVPGPDPSPTAEKELVRADAQALLAHFRDRLRASATAGARTGGTAILAIGAPMPTSSGLSADSSAPAGTPTSSTPLQEAGVDEDDVLRTDGDLVWTLSPPEAGRAQRLGASRLADGGATLASAGGLELDGTVRWDGLYVDGPRRRVVAVGRRDAPIGLPVDPMPAPLPAGVVAVSLPAPAFEPVAVLAWIDVADPARPRLARTVSMSGRLQATRVADGRRWAVLGGQPRYDGFDWSWRDAAANERWLAALAVERVLPTWRVDDGPAAPLLDGDACWLQPAAPGGVGATTSVVSIDLAAPEARPAGRCLVAPVETVYMAADALYLTTTRHPAATRPPTPGAPAVSFADAPVTDVHRLALAGGGVAYRGSGTVPGRLGAGAADTARFMLSADGPRLRVVSQRDGAGSAGPAVLSVLEDAGAGELKTIATLPNARRPEPIGKPGERVHAVRFVGARAYVVTFRNIDPVHTIDLADPADPKVLGALEVPGFSERLVPLTDTLLLGVGHDSVPWQGADLQTGVLVSLIDVADPARPVERARRTIGGRGSRSTSDLTPHGVTVVRAADGRFRVSLPVTVHDGDPWPWVALPDALRPRGFGRLAAFRFEVDPAAPALAERAPLEAPGVAAIGTGASRARAWDSPAFDRALDAGGTTWLWFDGRFVGAPW